MWCSRHDLLGDAAEFSDVTRIVVSLSASGRCRLQVVTELVATSFMCIHSPNSNEGVALHANQQRSAACIHQS